jgi:PAS domain S-box-containing protein/putative nucleotidyltransferase with HDIG domain
MKVETSWQLVDYIESPVLVIDQEGVIAHANSAAQELLGLEGEAELSGSKFFHHLPQDQTLLFETFLDDLVLGPASLDVILVTPSGKKTPVLLTGKKLPDQWGEGSIHMITVLDRSNSHDLVDSQDSVADDIEWLADQGRILLTMDNWDEILDLATETLQSKLGNCVVISLTKVNENTLQFERIAGIENQLLNRVQKLIGGEFYQREFAIDENFRDSYGTRSLYKHNGGLEDFAISQVPASISRKLAPMVGIENIYAIGLEGLHQVVGCFYIFTLTPDRELPRNLVESYVFQVAMALEKSKAAADLEQSENRFETFFEYAPDAYYISDLKGTFITGNIAAEEITGYPRSELIGNNFLKAGLISNNQLAKASKLLANNVLGKSTGPDEFILSRKDGSQVPVEISTYPVKIADESVVLGIARDISIRKMNEEELVRANQSVTRVLESIDAHVYVADLETYEILYMNKRMIEDFGGDFTGKTCYKVFRNQSERCPNCSLGDLLDPQGHPADVQIWESQNPKTGRWYKNYDRVIDWPNQRPVKLQIAVDITDSTQASQALKNSENRYRNLFENSYNALMTVMPPDWAFMSGNEAMMDLFQIESREQFRELRPWDLSPEFQPDGQPSKEKARQMILKAEEEGSHFFNWTHRTLTGKDFLATVHLTRVDLGENYVIQATVSDITDQVKAEEKLEQQMQDLTLLNELNVSANEGKDFNEILVEISVEMEGLFSGKSTTVYLLSDDERYLRVYLKDLGNTLVSQIEKIAGFSMPEHLEIELREDGIFKQILDSGDVRTLYKKEEIFDYANGYLASTFLSSKAEKRLRKLIPTVYSAVGIKSIMVAPLMSAGKAYGFIDMSGSKIFSDSERNRFKVFADQLSGFIQKINAENERETSFEELQFINQTITSGSRIDDIDEICKHLAQAVKKINPEAYLMVSLYDPDQEAIRVRAVEGLGKLGDRLFKLIGGRPEEFTVETDKYALADDLNSLYTSGKLERVPRGLFDLTRGKIPEKVCKSIEEITGISDVHIAGFGLEGKSTGGLVILSKKGAKIKFPAAIEAVVSHYSVIFERRIAQIDVLRRKTQLEALREIEKDLTSELDIDTLLQSISEKTKSIVNASAIGFSVYNPDRNVLEYKAYSGFEELPDNTDVYPGEGLSGKVFELGKTIIVEDYSLWEHRIEEWVPVSKYYLAGIPVNWGDEMLGVLEIALEPGLSLSKAELSMVELFAGQAAIAITNARLYHDEKLRRIESETLREVGLMINRLIDQPELLDMILLSLKKVVPFTSASVQLVAGSDVIISAYQGDNLRGDVLGTRYPIKENPAAHECFINGKTVVLNDQEEIGRVLQGQGVGEIGSWLGVTLESKNGRIGMLTIDHEQAGKYTDRDASLVEAFSSQAGVALENNRLFSEIHRRTNEIEAVYDSALSLTRELEPEVLIENLYEQIEPLFTHDAFILAVHDQTMDMIRVGYATEDGVRQPEAETLLISPEEKNSLLGWIVRNKVPLLIGNVEVDSLPFRPQQSGEVVRSFLGVPMLIGDRVNGVIVVQSYQPHSYTQGDQRLLELLANQAAIALENSRLFKEAHSRLSKLSSIHEIDQAISGSMDLNITMDVLLSHLTRTLEVDAACVLAYKKSTRTLEYVNAKGFTTSSLKYTSLKIGEGMAGKAALERTLVQIQDLTIQDTSLSESPRLSEEDFVSYMAEPLIAKGELVGVLEVFHRERLTPNPEWFNFLDSLSRSAAIAIERLNLFNDLTHSNFELQQAYDATIEGWARAIEMRDDSTLEHSRRVVALTMNLARKLGITGKNLLNIRRGALLHDIGKMAIPDGILLKTGKLTDEEWAMMKKHPQYAFDMLSTIEYLKPALDIPYCHHERWDGTGYPRGLAGEEIPLAARIFAVVDVWDALQSDRPYRDAWPLDKVVDYLKDQSGTHFDPYIVENFLDLIDTA